LWYVTSGNLGLHVSWLLFSVSFAHSVSRDIAGTGHSRNVLSLSARPTTESLHRRWQRRLLAIGAERHCPPGRPRGALVRPAMENRPPSRVR